MLTHHLQKESSAQTLATLGAAISQDLTAVFGCHTGTEPVGTLALEHAGLKRSFHDRISQMQSAPQPPNLVSDPGAGCRT